MIKYQRSKNKIKKEQWRYGGFWDDHKDQRKRVDNEMRAKRENRTIAVHNWISSIMSCTYTYIHLYIRTSERSVKFKYTVNI